MITVEKITPAIGGIVSGVDFSAPLTAEAHDAIYQALLDQYYIQGHSKIKIAVEIL